MSWAVDKIVIDCGQSTCTPTTWRDPVTVIALPFWQTIWMLVIGAILILAFIVATAIVRYRRHERLESEHRDDQQTERAIAARETTSCPTCGTVYVPEKVKA